jgi:hypothetical protein
VKADEVQEQKAVVSEEEEEDSSLVFGHWLTLQLHIPLLSSQDEEVQYFCLFCLDHLSQDCKSFSLQLFLQYYGRIQTLVLT